MSAGSESRVATAYARIREHLAYLGLSTASERLAGELERGKDEAIAPVEVLERLLAAEVEATSARRLSGRLRFAHYPLDKRLAQFEFDFQPSIDRAVIAELSTCVSSRSAATPCSLDHPGSARAISRSRSASPPPRPATGPTSRPRSTSWPTSRPPPRGQLDLEDADVYRIPLLIVDEVGCAPRGAISPGGQHGPPPVTAMAGRSWGQSDS